ncbi:hypothetical protein ACFE04_016428 [Oxalis oulophora]
MLSPTPLSLFCALLLCLPLAIVFTINTPTTPTSTTDSSSVADATVTYESKSPKTQNQLFPDQPTSKNHSFRQPLQTPTDEEYGQQYYDDEDDVALLKQASKVKSRPKSPKKLAFLFLTTAPLPFARLWDVYFANHRINHRERLFNIYVHADPRYNYTPPFQGVFANRVIPSKPTERNTPSLTAAARRLLANALLHDHSNSMFVLVSPSCIPLHSFEFTYNKLIKSRKSFIEILAHEEWSFDRWVARGDQAMLPEVSLEEFRIGSQFWVLTRKHAKLIVSDSQIWAKFNQRCVRVHTCFPEENYFPTLLHMRDARGIIPATLTFVNWTGCYDGHPVTYDRDEVSPELISTLRNERPRYGDDGANGSDLFWANRTDPFLFARKFHPRSARVLLRIARSVIFKD